MSRLRRRPSSPNARAPHGAPEAPVPAPADRAPRRRLLGWVLAVALAHGVLLLWPSGPADPPRSPPEAQAPTPPAAPTGSAAPSVQAVQTVSLAPAVSAAPDAPEAAALAPAAPPAQSNRPPDPSPPSANARRQPSPARTAPVVASPTAANARAGVTAHATGPAPSVAAETATLGEAIAPAEPDEGAAAVPPSRVVVPGPVVLRYAVNASRKGLSFSADSRLEWRVAEQRYEAQFTLQSTLAGARIQTSRGELDPRWGVVPQRFGDKNRGKAEQAAHFDRSRQPAAVRFSANTPDAPLPPGAQDRLSVLLQLAALLAGEPGRYTPGQHLRIYTIGAREAQWWDFEVKGTEELKLPIGTLSALHLLRTPTQPYDNLVELWMAPALGHLPVRVLWTQANGDVVDQQLVEHTP